MFEFTYVPDNDCERSSLSAAFHGQRRVLAYLGFPDTPEGFDDLLLRALDDLGAVVAYSEFSEPSRAVVAYSEFSEPSRAVVIDLEPHAADSTPIPYRRKRPDQNTPLAGCVGARPMRRW